MGTKKRIRTIPGVNIQTPWAELIQSGQKVIETRRYPLPKKYLHSELAIICTPGKQSGQQRSRAAIIGTMRVVECYEYTSKEQWLSEAPLHLVKPDDPMFAFKTGEPKWAWRVELIQKYSKPLPAPTKRGIKFALRCRVPTR